MFTDKVRIGGSLAFWKCGISDRELLAAGLKRIDLGKYTPEPRTVASALRGALQTTFKKGKDSSRTLVRPLEDKDGFAVLKETRGDRYAGNTAATICTATLPTETQAILMHGDYKPEDREAVVHEFQFLLGTLGSSAISKCLDKIIEYFGGVDMAAVLNELDEENSQGAAAAAAQGGAKSLWWIPKERIDDFRAVAEIVESCGIKKRSDGRGTCNRVTALIVIADAQMIRAVGDGIVNEVTAALREIAQEITDGLGKRAVTTRSNKVAALEAKVERYESAFGQYLFQIREGLKNTRDELAKATLLDTCAAIREQNEQLALV